MLAILDRLHHVDADTLGWWLCERQLPSGGLNGTLTFVVVVVVGLCRNEHIDDAWFVRLTNYYPSTYDWSLQTSLTSVGFCLLRLDNVTSGSHCSHNYRSVVYMTLNSTVYCCSCVRTRCSVLLLYAWPLGAFTLYARAMTASTIQRYPFNPIFLGSHETYVLQRIMTILLPLCVVSCLVWLNA